ncbi:hypothetical protein [Oryza sativa Japonica Group]|uniref:Uncharacterized protein n=3 Tax=Oryza TaxID=4527 RepID=Q5NBS9_ORYSJ|nr:hypothetical protein [Oryza sativa Japonica Group]BAE95796.1 hypothetical protein [Oryza sativa Japonica Group]
MAMHSASSSIHPTIHPVLFYILAGPYILLWLIPAPAQVQSGEEIISTLKYELEEKRNQVHRLQDDIEKCHVLIEDNAAKLKDNEQNRVELQEQTDRCQSSVRFWKYLFWLILLGLVASNYIAPKMI